MRTSPLPVYYRPLSHSHTSFKSTCSFLSTHYSPFFMFNGASLSLHELLVVRCSSGRRRIFVASSTYSNPKILKNHRSSRFGLALSPYDSEDDDADGSLDEDDTGDSDEDNDADGSLDEEDTGDSDEDDDADGSSDEDDGEDDENDGSVSDEEFAEPAHLDDGRKKPRLLAATKMRQGSNKPQNFSSTTETGGKLDGIRPAKKYPKLSEELAINRRWVPLLDYLSSFGLSESQLLQIYERHMLSFQVNVCSARERLEYLLTVGVKQKDIKRIILRQPQILEYTVENNLKVHVTFLRCLGIPDSRIGQIIVAAPSLFSYSVKNSLKPKVRYLIEEVGIKEKDLCKVIQLSPPILVQRVDISWTELYKFLRKELGAPRNSAVKMVTKHPQLLHYSIEDGLLPRIRFFRSIGMNSSDILKVLTSMTQVFSLSLEGNLKPKYKYLVNELKNEVHSLTQYPMYLSLSLDQRIRPRHRFLVFLKKAPKGPFPLGSLAPTDERFCQKWAKTSVDAYLAFRQRLMFKELAATYDKQ